MPDRLKIVHLPVYYNNAYQKLLMDEQRKLGHEVIDGGGGGNFMRTCLFKWKPDVLHIHWTHPYMIKSNLFTTWLRSFRFLLELKIIQSQGTKIVWTVHNLVSHDSKYPRLERSFLQKLVKLVNTVIVHGKAAKYIVASELNIEDTNKISIIPHGNYIGYYPDNVTKGQAREELKIDKNAFVLLFFGQIHPYKGVTDLIDAFRKLEAQHLVLIIAGTINSDKLLEEINHKIFDDPRIKLSSGYIEDNKLQYYFRATDLVVLPYRKILTSGSLILAMGFGCCCLVPDKGILSETVGNAGFVYTPGEAEAIQNALQNVLDNQNIINKRGTDARKKVEPWSFKKVAKKMEEVY